MRRLLLALLLATAAAAQPAPRPSDLLRAMEDAVARLDYETAEARAREALGRFDALTPDQLVTVHTTLGILLHSRNEPVEARRQFEAALSLDPGLTLDPVLVSPKTVEFFDELRAAVTPGNSGPVASEVRYVVLEDRRPEAALRSLVLPGWGQFYKGDSGKGWAFALTAGAVSAGTLAASFALADAKREYDEATTEEEFNQRYPIYNRWYRVRGTLVRGAAVVWAAAALDALITGAPAAPSQLSVEPAPEVRGVLLRARF